MSCVNYDLKRRIGCYCAPVLFHIKSAVTITLPGKQEAFLRKELEGTALQIFFLADLNEKQVFLVYRKTMEEKILKVPAVKAYLRQFGYGSCILPEAFFVLRKRYEEYVNSRMDFPHEIGIFLNYPLEDVKGYIQNKGKNSLLESYWKVYQNTEKAKQIFHSYNKAKEQVADKLDKGFTLKKIEEAIQ